MSSVEQFITSQMNLRLELIHNPIFIEQCISYVKSIGMSAEEWNQNKAGILMMIANEVVGYSQAVNN